MHFSLPSSLLGLAVLFTLAPAPVRAQQKASCAPSTAEMIRVEPGGILSPRKVVRGDPGVEVLKLGYRTRNLEQLLERSDSAVLYGIDYGRHQRRSRALMGVAFVTSFLLPLVVDFDDDRNRDIQRASWGVSFGLGFWGQREQAAAERSLARAVWHYNSTLHISVLALCGAEQRAEQGSFQ